MLEVRYYETFIPYRLCMSTQQLFILDLEQKKKKQNKSYDLKKLIFND